MKKPFTLNILLITRQLLLFSILFFGFTYANAANNANQINKSSYDATNLQAAFSVLKTRIESERKSLEKLSIACDEMGTKEQINRRVKNMKKQYIEDIGHPFSTSIFNEIVFKQKWDIGWDISELKSIQYELAEIKKNSNKDVNILCKASREDTLNLVEIKKLANETQKAAEKAKKLFSRMKEISSRLYSLSDTWSLPHLQFNESISKILDSSHLKITDSRNKGLWKCREPGDSFIYDSKSRRLLKKIHSESQNRLEQAKDLLKQAKDNNYKHTDIFQARYNDYRSFVNEGTIPHKKYLDCRVTYNYLRDKCVEFESELMQKTKERIRDLHESLLESLDEIYDFRREQLASLKVIHMSIDTDVAWIYQYELDADECMGNMDLNETTSVNTVEVPPISPESCTCTGGSIEVGAYKNESDCLKDQKIWSGDLVTWSTKNGGTCYRCPEEDVDCEEKVDRNSEPQKQPKQVNGTIWNVWGPIPYGYGTICLTDGEVSGRMKSGAKKGKDGWFGRKGGGTMRPTGKSCTKTDPIKPKPIPVKPDSSPDTEKNNSGLDPSKPNSINPNHPKVATLIKEWISSAEPPMNVTDGANARYEPYGRWTGEGINGIIGKVTANPDDVSGRTPEKYVWDKRDTLKSVDHCTLGEYVIAKLKNRSINHCKGRYKPTVNDVIGTSKKQAEERLRKKGLKTKVVLGNPALSKKDSIKVEKTIPSAGATVNRGDTVTIVIHPPFVDKRTVPNLKGLTEKEIIDKIKDAGLIPKVKKVKTSSSEQSGKVSTVKPLPGSEVVAGTVVYVDVFDTFDDRVLVPNVIGLGMKEAAKKIKEAGFKPVLTLGDITEDRSKDKTITEQKPKAGAKIIPGTEIEIVVCRYKAKRKTIPKSNSTKKQVYCALGKAGFIYDPNMDYYVFRSYELKENRRQFRREYKIFSDYKKNSLQRAQKIQREGKMKFIMKAPLKELCPHLKKNCHASEQPFVGDLCGKLDGPVIPSSGIHSEEEEISPGGKIVFSDSVESFGGGKSIDTAAKCDSYNKCLAEMMQQIQQLSLKMASSQGLTFGCKYLGLGQAIAKVSKDANSAGCKIAGNYEQTGDMIKETAGQMCKGQAIVFDINKLSSCRQLSKKTSTNITPDVQRNPKSQKQPKQVNGTIWKVWGPVPYGYGTKCLTDEEVSAYMKPGAMKSKDGWFGRKGGGTMKPTGKSCTKPEPGGKSSDGKDSKVVFSDSVEDFGGGKAVNTKNVPDVVGLGMRKAANVIKTAGFTPVLELGKNTKDPKKDKTIVRQVPKPGIKAALGSKIKMFIYTYKVTIPTSSTDFKQEQKKYLLPGGVPYIDVPKKILDYSFDSTIFDEWDVPKTFRGGRLMRPLAAGIENPLFKDTGVHAMTFCYQVSHLGRIVPFGICFSLGWLEPNDPIDKKKVKETQTYFCSEKKIHIESEQNSKGETDWKYVSVYSDDTWMGVTIWIPRPLFDREESLVKLAPEWISKIEPYAKRCKPK